MMVLCREILRDSFLGDTFRELCSRGIVEQISFEGSFLRDENSFLGAFHKDIV